MATKKTNTVKDAIKTATKFWMKTQIDLGKTQEEVLFLFSKPETKTFIKKQAVQFYI